MRLLWVWKSYKPEIKLSTMYRETLTNYMPTFSIKWILKLSQWQVKPQQCWEGKLADIGYYFLGRFENQIIRAPPWPDTLRPTARPHMRRVKALSAIFTSKSGDENRKIDSFGKIRPTTPTTLHNKGSGRKGSNRDKNNRTHSKSSSTKSPLGKKFQWEYTL